MRRTISAELNEGRESDVSGFLEIKGVIRIKCFDDLETMYLELK